MDQDRQGTGNRRIRARDSGGSRHGDRSDHMDRRNEPDTELLYNRRGKADWRRLRSTEGSAAVEFALIVPVVLVLLLGLAEVGSIAREQIQLWSAAREGARVAATTPDVSLAFAAAGQALGPLADRTRITVTRPAVVGDVARVDLTLVHRIELPLIGDFTFDLEAGAGMRVER